MKTEKVGQEKKNQMANILLKLDVVKFGVFRLDTMLTLV